MPSPGAQPVPDYDALDLGRDANGRWLIGTKYTDGSYVVWDADSEQEVAYIAPGRTDPADLGGGRAAVINPDGSLLAFDIANPPPQVAGTPPAGSGSAAAPNPHAPTGPVGTRNPGEDFNYGAIVGRYAPRFGGQPVSPTNAQTRGAGVEGIPYGWGVTGFGRQPARIQESHQAGLADASLSPGYIPGSGRYNQYDLTDPKLAGGLFGTIPGQSGMVNLRYGLGGTGDPTTGGEIQTPRRWITGNPNDSGTAMQGDDKWRATGGTWKGGGGWGGSGGGGDAPPGALTGGNEYATAGDLEALQVAEVQDAVQTGDPETIRRAGALAWAQGKISEQAYNQLCQQFVENAYGTGYGTPSMGQFPSAKLAAAGLGADRARQAGSGDLVFFNPDRSNNQYGHVGLATEGDPGSFISATANGVRNDNYLTDPYWSRLYAGSAAPPSSWPGQSQASGGGWDQAFAGAPAYQPGPGVSAAGGWQSVQPGVSIRQPGTGGGGMGGGFFGSNVTSNWGQTPETAGLDFIATLFLRSDTPTGIGTPAWSAPPQMWNALLDEIRKGRIYVKDPQAWQMLQEKTGLSQQQIGGAATGGQNVSAGGTAGGSSTEDAIANGNAAEAADKAAYWAYQQSLLRQGDQRIALEEARDAWTKAYQTAGLTGQFNGADTMAMQQQRFAQDLANRQFGLSESGVTGTYQGQKTQQAIAQENAAAQALLSLQASLKGPRDWARYQSTFGATPQGLRDVLAAYQGRYALPTGQGAAASAQGGRASVSGLAGDILSGTYGQDSASTQALGNPRQADIQNWARMQPSQREMILGQYEDQGWYGDDVLNVLKGAAPRASGPSASSYNFFQQ